MTCNTSSRGGNTPQDTNYMATCLPSRKLSKLDKPDMQDTAGEAGTSSYVMYSYGPPHMAGQKQDDQHKHTFSSYVRIRDVALKTCQRRWTIGKSGERGSGISVLLAQHDDDEYIQQCSFTPSKKKKKKKKKRRFNPWKTYWTKFVDSQGDSFSSYRKCNGSSSSLPVLGCFCVPLC